MIVRRATFTAIGYWLLNSIELLKNLYVTEEQSLIGRIKYNIRNRDKYNGTRKISVYYACGLHSTRFTHYNVYTVHGIPLHGIQGGV